MANINLLIVEDEDKQLQLYTDAIDDFNSAGGNIFVPTIEKNQKTCSERLKSNEFDAAIVDLRLENDASDEASGNDILREIKESHRFPILVVTGTPGHLDPNINKNIFLTVHERTAVDTTELLKNIETIYLTGITHILGTRGRLEELIQQIFWNHISDGFEYWLGKVSEEALLRYSINHLTEYLGQSEIYLEPEVYITPPIREEIATGDMVEKDGCRHIVMNPACDLEPRGKNGDKVIRNSNEITLVEVLDFTEEKLKSGGYLTNEQTLNKSRISDLVKNLKVQYAFLPKYNNIGCGVMDFRKISTIGFEEYKKYNRLATIAMPFLKDIQGRFSQYYGRQGAPDLDKERIIDGLP